jgi:hypothetical protein
MLSERLVTRVDLCEESNKVEPIELKVKEWWPELGREGGGLEHVPQKCVHLFSQS